MHVQRWHPHMQTMETKTRAPDLAYDGDVAVQVYYTTQTLRCNTQYLLQVIGTSLPLLMQLLHNRLD